MPSIVIVDDRVTNRRILSRLASKLDSKPAVETFADPVLALGWLERNAPDLVVTDFKMPNLDGAEFVRSLRRLPTCSDIPEIVVTAYEDKGFRYEALNAGATNFLLSPLDHKRISGTDAQPVDAALSAMPVKTTRSAWQQATNTQ